MSISSSLPNSLKENSARESNLNLELEIDQLFSNLTIRENNNYTMALIPKFDNKLLEIIPKFDGNPLELSSFLETSNTLIKTYWDQTNIDCVQNITLIYGIYAKLIGKAREVYSICISKDWRTVKDALIAHFGDQRDENGLLFDLDQMRQNGNEPALQFYTRVMSNLSALHNYIDTHEERDEIKAIKKTFYNTHALKIFLAGLKEPLGSTIRAMKPTTLAEARQFIISENNIRHLQKPYLDNTKNRLPQKTNYHQNYKVPNFNFPTFQNIRPHSYENTSFPQGPINVQPRNTFRQNFPTNRQVFGPPKNSTNVWKPNPQNRNNQNKPTPMSGISYNSIPKRTIIQHPVNNKPNFIAEELYNIEQPTHYNLINTESYCEPYQENYNNTHLSSYPEYVDSHYLDNQISFEIQNNYDKNPLTSHLIPNLENVDDHYLDNKISLETQNYNNNTLTDECNDQNFPKTEPYHTIT